MTKSSLSSQLYSTKPDGSVADEFFNRPVEPAFTAFFKSAKTEF